MGGFETFEVRFNSLHGDDESSYMIALARIGRRNKITERNIRLVRGLLDLLTQELQPHIAAHAPAPTRAIAAPRITGRRASHHHHRILPVGIRRPEPDHTASLQP